MCLLYPVSTAFTTGFLKRAPSIKSGSDNGNVTQSFRCSVRIWKFQLCNGPFNPVPMYDSSGAVSAQIGIFLFFLYLGNVIQRHSVAFLHLFIEFLIICGDIGIVQPVSITAQYVYLHTSCLLVCHSFREKGSSKQRTSIPVSSKSVSNISSVFAGYPSSAKRSSRAASVVNNSPYSSFFPTEISTGVR